MNNPLLNFQMPGKLCFGRDAILELPGQVRRLGATRVLLVTDPGVVACGLANRAGDILKSSGIQCVLFSSVEPDPCVQTPVKAASAAAGAAADIVVGLGGGSAIDVAKLAAVLARDPGDPLRFAGIGKIPTAGLPVIAIPTTAGTGSEVTPIAVLSDTEAHLKKGIVSEHLIPKVALVDPQLTVSLPPHITAYTGMDALTHCIEAYTNRFAQPFVDTLALEGIRLIGGALRTAVRQGNDVSAREAMALASLYGGLCLGPVNTAAVHAMAYPLGGTFNVPHGLANTVLLPEVMAFNLPACAERYARIATALGVNCLKDPAEMAANKAVEAVRTLARDVNMNVRLRDLGVPASAIPTMAREAVQVTRLMQNNPRALTVEDTAAIYTAAH
jgi:alcohol dehydrogenase class IV